MKYINLGMAYTIADFGKELPPSQLPRPRHLIIVKPFKRNMSLPLMVPFLGPVQPTSEPVAF